MSLSAVAINATLKASDGESSSTDAMIDLISSYLKKSDVTVKETIRLADHDIKPGVTSDEGDGDAWPGIREKILAADILIFGTPIWMGQPSSIAKRVMERMDAFLSETDDAGRTPAYGKVMLFAIVGNEDGAHFSTAAMGQALNDVGWTIPPASACYWVGEAMNKKDFKDLKEVPKVTRETAQMAAANAVHLSTLLKKDRFPGMAD
ncbi:NAD(P)H-dependent oxidoreductase [Sphingomonas sp. LY29]|uniref:flavodoxin family protein n=1 Tax=Sphingomonas sp. LY29 TaxID=3095341 RepID=UPI002D78253F|nr:NAD(P)H-dependent oxidoreductase [Sphingomonas sp. LY29]WRP25945.1 NAD(P)H-dependent oxidoreductase [Sphingomonas sp. LY29]